MADLSYSAYPSLQLQSPKLSDMINPMAQAVSVANGMEANRGAQMQNQQLRETQAERQKAADFIQNNIDKYQKNGVLDASAMNADMHKQLGLKYISQDVGNHLNDIQAKQTANMTALSQLDKDQLAQLGGGIAGIENPQQAMAYLDNWGKAHESNPRAAFVANQFKEVLSHVRDPKGFNKFKTMMVNQAMGAASVGAAATGTSGQTQGGEIFTTGRNPATGKVEMTPTGVGGSTGGTGKSSQQDNRPLTNAEIQTSNDVQADYFARMKGRDSYANKRQAAQHLIDNAKTLGTYSGETGVTLSKFINQAYAGITGDESAKEKLKQLQLADKYLATLGDTTGSRSDADAAEIKKRNPHLGMSPEAITEGVDNVMGIEDKNELERRYTSSYIEKNKGPRQWINVNDARAKISQLITPQQARWMMADPSTKEGKETRKRMEKSMGAEGFKNFKTKIIPQLDEIGK